MEDDDQTRKSPIPVPPVPDLAGNRGGNPRFPTRPASGIGKSPVSRFGRDRESRSRDRELGSRGRHAGDFLVCGHLRSTPSAFSAWVLPRAVPFVVSLPA
jgi:hypothetical protein